MRVLRRLRSEQPPDTASFLPITDILNEAPPEPAWLWEGFLVGGSVTLVAGHPKVGKSTFVTALLAALASGVPFLGRSTRATGAVVLTEERDDGLAEKARRFGLDGTRVHVRTRNRMVGVSWPQLVEEAVAHAEKHGLGLLVVDTFADLAGLSGDEENDSGAVMDALRPLQEAANRGLAVLVVAHRRKSGGSHGSGVRGSSALTGAVDVVVELDRGGGKSTRILRSQSRFQATPEKLVMELAGDHYSVPQDASQGDEAKILVAIEERGPLTEKALEEETGIPRSTLQRRVDSLTETEPPRLIRRGDGTKGDPHILALAPG